jgi:DNA ligase (NAD+)
MENAIHTKIQTDIVNNVSEDNIDMSFLSEMSESTLSDFIQQCDVAYERGEPFVSDYIYDQVFSYFSNHYPDSDLVTKVRPDYIEDDNLEKVRHSSPMLSTEKAYTKGEIDSWLKKVADEASEIGLDVKNITFSVTPKLDGLAGRHERGVLATRGDGVEGFNVSHVYDIGVKTVGGISDGNGELVLSKKYFEKELSEQFSHPRNVMVGIVKADTLTETSLKTLADGAAYFIRYDELPSIKMTYNEIKELIDAYPFFVDELILKNDFEFPIDGFVVVVDNKELSDYMGYNSHHYHSVIALKEHGEMKEAKVIDVILQIGRTGRITPVILIEPTLLSGAMVSRVTGHNLTLLEERGIGKGATIKVVRSGEVIPYVVDVVNPVESNIEKSCPSCNGEITQVSDAVFECLNTSSCPAQLINTIVYHFKTLDIKNFGYKTVEKIVDSGKVSSLSDVYSFSKLDYQEMGFGERQAEVLIESIDEVKSKEVEPAKLLASFGVRGLGNRASKAILNFFELHEFMLRTPSIEDISNIENFGEKTARAIHTGIQNVKNDYLSVVELGITPIEKKVNKDSVIYGKNIIFTGTMSSKGRKEMETDAESLGANIQKSVTKKTDILIYGDKAGSKLQKAEKLGVECLTESEYKDMIG